MKNQSTLYIDGHFVQADAKMPEAFTPGIFQGDGVFETLLAVGDKVFDIKDHLKRLKGSMKAPGITDAVVLRVVKAHHYPFSRVRILAWKEKKQIHTAVMALPYTVSPKAVFQVGLLQTDRRANDQAAHRKSLDYQMFYDAYQQAHAKGLDEVLLLNRKGHVFEASRSNVFWSYQGQLLTPPLSSGCLAGITRSQVIAYAKTLGRPVKEQQLSLKELKKADSIFLTNSLIGIKPARLAKNFL